MYQGKSIGAVIVAHNEAGLVGGVIETLPEFVDRAYVVDDGSTDGTWDEIQTHAQRVNERRADIGRTAETRQPTERGDDEQQTADDDQRELPRRDGGIEQSVVPIRHETNTGVGGAIKTGYRRAYEDGIDVTVVMAGDGQMDPDECHRIVDPVATGRADYAKGNRLLDAELREEMSNWRLFGNTLLTILTKIASGYWKMMDPSNGYTAISREALDELDIDAVYDDYGAAHDILIRLNVENMRVADVPLPASYGEEESGIKYSSFVPNLSLLLLRGFLWRLKTKYLVRDCHPFVLFYGLGVLGGVIALIEGLRNAIDSDSSRTRTLLAGVLFLVSASLVTFGMVFDLLDNQDLEFRADE
ncbi:glycosyltransferase family 2 protein [Salinibaculum salinum]|uniref:glycosyltransferase family 2 protein n=1 Tax=Salinibaculum salinum TaxID=3131996 RepID=UPI0030ECBE49